MSSQELIRIINDPALHDTIDCSDEVFEGIEGLCDLIETLQIENEGLKIQLRGVCFAMCEECESSMECTKPRQRVETNYQR